MAVAMIFFNWFVPEDHQPNWVAQAKAKPLLNQVGEKLINLLPEDPEEQLMEKIKERKGKNQAKNDTSYKSNQAKELDQLVTKSSQSN
ncbi:MAG: CvpA family protein, partial [Cohaesibacter sp.]|nr:CvpA family protein [Cohaesibacter sp.]